MNYPPELVTRRKEKKTWTVPGSEARPFFGAATTLSARNIDPPRAQQRYLFTNENDAFFSGYVFHQWSPFNPT